jgi:hypothetical protein
MFMLCVKAQVKNSEIAGQGLFTQELIKQGTIVAIFSSSEYSIFSEEAFQAEFDRGNPIFQQSGTRLVGQYYTANGDRDYDENYINHSDTPNLLFHCGICFAWRDIQPGEELTFDYRYASIPGVAEPFETAQGKVIGLPAKEALIQSAQALIQVLEAVDVL